MNEKVRVFTDLIVWQKGHAVVLDVYTLTKDFPTNESFGLTSQMRRAAVSITSNIAEGFSRESRKEKIRFFSIAHGSAMELHNQLLISKDIGYLSEQQYSEIIKILIEVQKMLVGLSKSAEDKDALGTPILNTAY